MKRHLFLTVIATLAISMFVACNNGEDSDTFPLLNKRSFSLASQNLDTLYSVDKSAYTLGGMEVMSRASDTVIGDLRLSPENTSIIANGKKVGTVAYRYGRVETIDIPIASAPYRVLTTFRESDALTRSNPIPTQLPHLIISC